MSIERASKANSVGSKVTKSMGRYVEKKYISQVIMLSFVD